MANQKIPVRIYVYRAVENDMPSLDRMHDTTRVVYAKHKMSYIRYNNEMLCLYDSHEEDGRRITSAYID